MQEELEEESGDPEYPKLDFPTAIKCPKCRKPDGRWVSSEVVSFLSHFYGPEPRTIKSSSDPTTLSSEPSGKNRDTSSTIAEKGEADPKKVENSSEKLDQEREADGDRGAAQKHSDGVDGGVGKAGGGTVPGAGGVENGKEKPKRKWWSWRTLLWMVGGWFFISIFFKCRWCAPPSALVCAYRVSFVLPLVAVLQQVALSECWLW